MEKKRPKGSKQIRQEKRGGKLFWGYHVWLRQADGSRKQVRDFSFNTKEEAKEALRVVQTAGWKTRYGLIVKKTNFPIPLIQAIVHSPNNHVIKLAEVWDQISMTKSQSR